MIFATRVFYVVLQPVRALFGSAAAAARVVAGPLLVAVELAVAGAAVRSAVGAQTLDLLAARSAREVALDAGPALTGAHTRDGCTGLGRARRSAASTRS